MHYKISWLSIAVVCCQQSALRADPGTSLADFASQYSQIESISLAANVTYLLDPASPACSGPAGIPILGVYSYTAKHDLWRSRSYLDHEATNIRTEVAYDGAMYQYHQLSDDILGISFGDDDRGAGFVLPNPLFAAGQFLIPVSDENANMSLRLCDLQAASAATDLSTLTWNADAISFELLEYTDLPGASHEGFDYIHRVFVRVGERNKPIRIDRVASTGEVLTRTLLSSYADFSGGIRFPTSYTMILFNPENRAAESGRITMTVVSAEINSAATDSLDIMNFQIPWNLDGRIWLIDNQVFVN
jgi:hypothetical protein